MAITRLNPVATSQANTNSLVATMPTGVVAGTVLKALIVQDTNGATFTPPAGWTIDRTDNITNGDDQTTARATRVSDGTDGPTATFGSNASHNTSVLIGGWNGVDTTTTERDQSANNPNSVSVPTSPITLNGLTVSPQPGDQLVYMATVDTNGNDGVYTLPSGFAGVQTTSGLTFNSGMIADMAATVGGPTGTITATWTLATGTGNYIVYVIALKQKVVAPPTSYFLESNEYF